MGIDGYLILVVTVVMLCYLIPVFVRRRIVLIGSHADDRYSDNLRVLMQVSQRADFRARSLCPSASTQPLLPQTANRDGRRAEGQRITDKDASAIMSTGGEKVGYRKRKASDLARRRSFERKNARVSNSTQINRAKLSAPVRREIAHLYNYIGRVCRDRVRANRRENLLLGTFAVSSVTFWALASFSLISAWLPSVFALLVVVILLVKMVINNNARTSIEEARLMISKLADGTLQIPIAKENRVRYPKDDLDENPDTTEQSSRGTFTGSENGFAGRNNEEIEDGTLDVTNTRLETGKIGQKASSDSIASKENQDATTESLAEDPQNVLNPNQLTNSVPDGRKGQKDTIAERSSKLWTPTRVPTPSYALKPAAVKREFSPYEPASADVAPVPFRPKEVSRIFADTERKDHELDSLVQDTLKENKQIDLEAVLARRRASA